MSKFKFLTLIVALLFATSCVSRVEDQIEFKGAKVADISSWPVVAIDVDVENLSRYKIKVHSAEFTLREQGKINKIAVASLTDVAEIPSRSTTTVRTYWRFSVESVWGGISLMSRMAKEGGMDSVTVDYNIVGSMLGIKRSYIAFDIPLGDLE